MRVVLDTNTLVSGVISPGGPSSGYICARGNPSMSLRIACKRLNRSSGPGIDEALEHLQLNDRKCETCCLTFPAFGQASAKLRMKRKLRAENPFLRGWLT